MQNKLFVIGAGPGCPEQLTFAARNAIRSATCVVAPARHMPLAEGHPNAVIMGKFSEAFERVTAELEKGPVAVIVSGDTGVFSLLPLIKKRFPAEIIEVLPGISSLQYLAALTRETWIDAEIISGHGRPMKESTLLQCADTHAKTIFFCGPEWAPKRVCEVLKEIPGLKVTIGERLSYPSQCLSSGSPAELAGKDYDDLALVLIQNSHPWEPFQGRPCDEDFIRTKVPMTRQTVRSAIIDELCLKQDSVLWDLGAGTGSISIAAALFSTEGAVHAVEKNPEAVDLIRQNKGKFHCYNLTVHAGDNAEVLPELPLPTHVFVGGSGPELPQLLHSIAALGNGIRVVVSAVAFKTYSASAEILSGPEFHGFDATQVSVSRARKIGSTFIMNAQNPITIFSAYTGPEA